MKLEGEYVFNGPREIVWETVYDPEVLATVVPGLKEIKRLSASEYEGIMAIHIGPVSGSFSGLITVSEEIPPESYKLTVEGKGAAGFAKGFGYVRLSDAGAGKTLMKYEGEVNIGGKIANVGQRMVDTVSKSMIKQGLEKLNKVVESRAL